MKPIIERTDNNGDNSVVEEQKKDNQRNEELLEESCSTSSIMTIPRDRSASNNTVRKPLHRIIGISLMVLACLTLTVSDFTVSQMSSSGVQIIPFISLLSCSFLNVATSFNGFRRSFVSPQAFAYMVMRGMCYTIFVEGFYYALQNMPLAENIVILATSSGMVVVIAWICLEERPGITEGGVIVAMIGGVVLISRPSFIFPAEEESDKYPNREIAAAVGLGAAFFYSLTMVINRKVCILNGHYLGITHVYTVILLITSTIVHLVSNGGIVVPSCGSDRYYILLLAIMLIINGILIAMAMMFESATIITAMGNLQVVVAFFAQYFIARDTENSVLSFLGAIIIVAGSLVLVLKAGVFTKETMWCRYC